MSWNEYLYQYHQKNGGQFLAGAADDALLALTWRDRPLVVDLDIVDGGRGSTCASPRVRIPVTLAKPCKLTIGAEKKTSSQVNSALKALSGITGCSADFGFPEVTNKRLILCSNQPFFKLVLSSPELRNALLACPEDKVLLRSGPGEEGLHLITVTTDAPLYGAGRDGGWYVDGPGDYMKLYASEEERAWYEQRAASFSPRMDRFLELARAVYDALIQWPM